MRLAWIALFALGCSSIPGRPAPAPADTPAPTESPAPEAPAPVARSERPTQDVLELRAMPGGPPTFALVNVSRSDQSVLPALDGSEVGWRVPRITMEYRDATGASVPLPQYGRCGNMNPLLEQDFVTLAPGAELALPGIWMRVEPPPGATEARMIYDTRTQGRRELGDRAGDPAEALRDLPEGVWTSEWVAVR